MWGGRVSSIVWTAEEALEDSEQVEREDLEGQNASLLEESKGEDWDALDPLEPVRIWT